MLFAFNNRAMGTANAPDPHTTSIFKDWVHPIIDIIASKFVVDPHYPTPL
jgi:hypothetical protein